jgi:hypothetical protein
MKKILVVGLVMLWVGGAAFGLAFSSSPGCVPDLFPYRDNGTDPMHVSTHALVTDALGASLTAGSTCVVQYIYLGSHGYIDDPASDGSVPAGNVLVNTAANYVGDDLDTGNTFPSTAGRFCHSFSQNEASQFSAVAAGGNQFYVRVWDQNPANPGAKFGESDFFSPSVASQPGDPPPTPNTVGLATFKAQFSKAAPAAPVVGGASGINPAPPSATLNWTSVVGARYYSYQVATLEDTGYTNVIASGTVYNTSKHVASVDNSTAKSVAVSLGTFGDNKNYRFRVKAGNDFGESASWADGTQFFVPATPSNNRPVAVSDLRVATSDATSITVRWTAPYYQDGHSVQQAVPNYFIRIATTPILDSWNLANSNPQALTNWASATPVTSAPYNATLPTPALYPVTQEVTITCPTGSTYFLALKSTGEVYGSYISNVTGAPVGSSGSGHDDFTLTIESRATDTPAPTNHGINHFSMPFRGPWFAYTTGGTLIGPVANAYDLVRAINTAYDPSGATKIVSTFTAWRGAQQNPNETGVLITNNDPDLVMLALQAVTLANGQGYELYATKPTRLVIKNY